MTLALPYSRVSYTPKRQSPLSQQPPYIAEGARIGLRSFCTADAESYSSWLQDPELCRLVGESPRTPAEVIQRQQGWDSDPGFLELMIVDKEKALPIGDISLKNMPAEPTLGIMIADPRYRSRGYGSEAIRVLFSYAGDKLNLTHIYSEVFDFNTGSLEFHYRLGFVPKNITFDEQKRRCILLEKKL